MPYDIRTYAQATVDMQNDECVSEQSVTVSLTEAIEIAKRQQNDCDDKYAISFTFVRTESDDMLYLITNEGNEYTDKTDPDAYTVATMLAIF